MLRVIQQKASALESKLFDRFGSKDFNTSDANSKIASSKLKVARDNTLFVVYSGINLAITMFALSLLFSWVSSAALASKALLDFMLEYILAVSIVSATACACYIAPKIANVIFAGWDAKVIPPYN